MEDRQDGRDGSQLSPPLSISISPLSIDPLTDWPIILILIHLT